MTHPQIRPIAICVLRKGDTILVSEGYDKVKLETFYRPLGGAIEFGERSEDALRREIKEEINADVTDLRLLGVMDNLFVFEGKPGHEIVMVYDGTLTDPAIYERGVVNGLHGVDDGIPFTATWKRLNEFGEGKLRLYPDGLKDLLVQESVPSPEANTPANIVVRECRAAVGRSD